MKLQRTLSVDDLNDFERKRDSWNAESKAVKEPGVARELCYVAIVDVSDCHGDVRIASVGSYCQN